MNTAVMDFYSIVTSVSFLYIPWKYLRLITGNYELEELKI